MNEAMDKVQVGCECGLRAHVPSRYRGRKVACKRCGEILRIPRAAARRPDPAPTPARAERGRCRQCFAPSAPEARVCLRCGTDQHTGRGPRAVERSSRPGRYTTKEFFLPLVLFAAGFLAWVGMLAGVTDASLGQVLAHCALNLAVWLPCAVGAAMVACWMLSCTFGNLGPAMLKLAAVAVCTTAIAGAGGLIGGLPLSFVAGLFGYFILATWLLEITIFEAFVFSVVLWLTKIAAGALLTAVLG